MTSKMPLQVWVLTLSAFAMGTAKFVTAGTLTQVADSLYVSTGPAGHLITAYALAIVVGGPILTLWLARFDKRQALLGLMAVFIAGNVVAASTDSYAVLLPSPALPQWCPSSACCSSFRRSASLCRPLPELRCSSSTSLNHWRLL